MFKYLKESFARKKARRVFQEYDYTVATCNLEKEGTVQFAHWNNPLMGAQGVSQAEVDFYRQSVSTGDMALDIGANIGDTTVPMALAVGKEGLIVAFDPNPVVYKILAANASLNKDKTNIVPLNSAASDKEEEFYYISSEASFSNGGLSLNKDEKKLGGKTFKQKVHAINALQYLIDNHSDKLPNLKLIKVDTEGFDLRVLKNLSELIDRYHPNIIAECFFNIPDEEKYALHDFLVSKGYTVYDLGHFSSFDREHLKVISRNEMLNPNNFNVYAVQGGVK